MPLIPGSQLQEITAAFADAFDPFELAQLLRNELDERLDRIVAPGRFDQVVFELLQWAERHGREAELLQAAHRVKPRHPGLDAIHRRYGLGPAISVQKAGARLPAAEAEVDAGALERAIKSHLPMVDAGNWRERLAALEGRVCRVEINDPGRATMGTGFLVGPDLVLTNFHVVQSVVADPERARALRCRFDYRELPNGARSEGVVVGLHASDWLVDHSSYSAGEAKGLPDEPPPAADELDHALLRLERPLGAEAFHPGAGSGVARGWIRIPASPPSLEGPALFILQHPNRAPLKLALDTQADPQLVHHGLRLRYATTTEAGSSGAPCFDAAWGLLALHHYGDPAWQAPRYNQGIPIARIRERLERLGFAAVLGGGSSGA